MKKYLLLTLISFCCIYIVSAQQNAQYSQFMFNKLAINPAYAGSNQSASIVAMYRSQWIGVEGAPTTQLLTAHTPLPNGRAALGLSIINDFIGPTNNFNLHLNYAYRVPLAKGNFAMGIQGIFQRYLINQDKAKTLLPDDQLFAEAQNSRMVGNTGVGFYYEGPTAYAGISVNQIIPTDISLLSDEVANNNIESIAEPHFYLMGGKLVTLSSVLRLKPAFLFKYARNAPIDFEGHISFIFYDQFIAGLSLRQGGSSMKGGIESVDLIAQMLISDQLRIGAAYDITLSEITPFNSGTIEILLSYSLERKKRLYNSKLRHPRFF